MPTEYKVTYSDYVPTYPGWDGNCSFTQTGTYTDVLYKSTAVGGETAGTLSGNIYDYDMITVFPQTVGAFTEVGIGTKYCPKDITTGGRMHYFCVNGGGNMYMTDAVIQWDNGTAFTSRPITNTNPGIRLNTSMSVSGTTAKYNRFSDYATTYAGVGRIVGTKYYGNRDNLFSATETAQMPQTVNLTKPFTGYDHLQIKIRNKNVAEGTNTDYENAGYWTEALTLRDTGTFHATFIGGNGGGVYLYGLAGGWNNASSVTMKVGKPLVWNVTTTANVTQTPNYSANYYISEIWGVK